METDCVCGSQAQLQYKNEPGRIKGRFIIIKNVPILYCEDCKEEYMTGPNSLRFAERVKQAVESGENELEF
uniref:YgiT-type zinc finger protein n=1 Tax=Paenibacillus sp. FSL R5-0701 TaxID=2921654 RepID=UPI00403F884E